MKKLVLALIVALTSCSAENENTAMLQQDLRQITVSIEGTITDEAESRVFRDDAGQFLWEKNDTLGIFPNVGGQVEFAIDEKNVGTTKATFDGGGWALRNSYTYSAYCPFNFYNRNVKAIPMSYTGLVQDGNNSKSHLSNKLFLASAPVTVVDRALSFTMSHRGALIELALTLPQAGTYTSVDLYTSAEIFPIEVTFDLQSAQLTQTNVKYSNHYTLKLNNVKTTAANEVVTVWFVTPAVVDKTKTLKAVVRDSRNNTYVSDVKTSNGSVAAVNSPARSKRTLNAAPVLSDGVQAGIEDWEIGEEILGSAN